MRSPAVSVPCSEGDASPWSEADGESPARAPFPAIQEARTQQIARVSSEGQFLCNGLRGT